MSTTGRRSSGSDLCIDRTGEEKFEFCTFFLRVLRGACLLAGVVAGWSELGFNNLNPPSLLRSHVIVQVNYTKCLEILALKALTYFQTRRARRVFSKCLARQTWLYEVSVAVACLSLVKNDL